MCFMHYSQNWALPLKASKAEVHPAHICSSYLPCPVLQTQLGLLQTVSLTVISHCCPFQKTRTAGTVWLSPELSPPGSHGQVLCSAQGSVLLLGPAHKPKLQKKMTRKTGTKPNHTTAHHPPASLYLQLAEGPTPSHHQTTLVSLTSSCTWLPPPTGFPASGTTRISLSGHPQRPWASSGRAQLAW